jgi:hypothetical protein
VLIYATSTDLATWTGTTAPANAAQLLRSASLLVREATMAACYDVDDTGLPSDATLLQAFNDATCAQAAFWAANGIDPGKGVAGIKLATSKSIGSANVGYANGTIAIQAAADSITSLVPDAARVLADIGLITNAPWIG